MRLYIDFEVYSAVSIKEAPLDVYAADPTTKVILCAYAFDDGPVQVWEPDYYPIPPVLQAGLRDENVCLVAWNVGYERTVLAAKGRPTPISRWLDPMVHARYAGLPGKLKDCAKIPMIGVPPEEKTKSETLLIRKFCMPNKEGKRTMPMEYSADWSLFIDYCRKDVQTMRHIQNWLEPRFPFPERERRLWMLDQEINGRGLPVDVEMAKHGIKETARILSLAHTQLKDITGLDNPNSVQQLHPWLTERGYSFDSLGKEFLAAALESNSLTAEAREVVGIRTGAAKASVKKFKVMVERASI